MIDLFEFYYRGHYIKPVELERSDRGGIWRGLTVRLHDNGFKVRGRLTKFKHGSNLLTNRIIDSFFGGAA